MSDEREGRWREKAERWAKRRSLSEEQTEELAAAYPAWEARQPPSPLDDEDAYYEWRFEGEDGPAELSKEVLENVPVGSVVAPFDEALLQRPGARVAVPSYETGSVRFVPVGRMTREDWQAVKVGMLEQPTTGELFGMFAGVMERQTELRPELGPEATVGEVFSEGFVEESADSPASLSAKRREKEPYTQSSEDPS